MKNPLTPAGIEPATFRFVAQHLNHCATLPRSLKLSGKAAEIRKNLNHVKGFLGRIQNPEFPNMKRECYPLTHDLNTGSCDVWRAEALC